MNVHNLTSSDIKSSRRDCMNAVSRKEYAFPVKILDIKLRQSHPILNHGVRYFSHVLAVQRKKLLTQWAKSLSRWVTSFPGRHLRDWIVRRRIASIGGFNQRQGRHWGRHCLPIYF